MLLLSFIGCVNIKMKKSRARLLKYQESHCHKNAIDPPEKSLDVAHDTTNNKVNECCDNDDYLNPDLTLMNAEHCGALTIYSQSFIHFFALYLSLI